MSAVRADESAPVSTAWLVGVARHKLSDHSRRQAREELVIRTATRPDGHDDPWEAQLDALRAVDDQGIRFAVHEPPGTGGGPRPEAARDGDLAYVTVEVPDSSRAREFYASVLGWHFVPGRAADGWQVEDVRPMTGISGSHVEAAGIPLWRVTDLPAAVARVRVAGGLASEPRQEPYGLVAQCTDDQGIRFQLCQFP